MVHRYLNRLCPEAMQGLFVRNKETRYDNTRGDEKLQNWVGGPLQLDTTDSTCCCFNFQVDVQ